MSSRDSISVSYNNKVYKFLIPLNKDSHVYKDPDLYVKDFDKSVNFLKNFLKDGDIAVDIGARDGDSTLSLRAIVGDKGKILAFEPNPYEFPNLLENIKLNNFSNIKAYNFAISKEYGEKEFLFEEGFYNGGINTDQIKVGYFPNKINLPCENWQSLSQEIKNDFKNVKFIKTDTEGYDIDILEELSVVINSCRPFILMEWWPTIEKRMAEYCNNNNYIPFNPDNLSLIQSFDLNKRVHDVFLIPKEILQRV
jgi:FkbM family methyltransferase